MKAILALCLGLLPLAYGAGRGLQQFVAPTFGQALPISTQQPTGTLFGQLNTLSALTTQQQTTSGPGNQVPQWTGQALPATRPVPTTTPAVTTSYPAITVAATTNYPTTTPAATTTYPVITPSAITYPTTTPGATTTYPTTTPAATTTYPTTIPAATTTYPTTTPSATTPAATTTSPSVPASKPTSTPTSPAPTTAAGSGSGCPDVDAVLQRHNYYRSQHGAAPLTWNAQIAAVAQSWSEHCVMQHSQNGYGENLAQGVSTCAAAVDLWMSEQSSYVPGSDFSMATGHYTQVVWAGTTQLGCGFAAGCNMVTCNYSPAGNVVGQFGANVH